MFKRLALLAVLALAATPALAATDVATAVKSMATLRAAINAGAGTSFTSFVFIPGYGVSTQDSDFESDNTAWVSAFAQVKGLSAVLWQTLQGLDPNEYVSFNFEISHYGGTPSDTFTARQKFSAGGKPEAWEVFVNGVKQP